VVLILVDDAGFSATSTFGGQAETPNFSKLAEHGLRYNAFAVNAICSPTRASLLTGRNCHQVGFGTVAERATPYPGYNSEWPKSAASIAEVLKENGYNTAAFGKWHNTPLWQSGPTGPFDHWPTSLGFDHFYGFINGWDNQYYPRIFQDTVAVEPPSTPAEGYNFTADMTDQAVRWLHEIDAVNPARPFFVYYATGATHWPLQVPKEWIAKYKGKFDEGWDVLRERTFARQKKMGIIPANAELTKRPEGLPAWDSLSPDQKRLLARQAEVYAAYAEQADFEIGRLLKAIEDEGKSQNTFVLEIFGDNGGSAQGGLLGTDAFDVAGNRKTVPQRLETMDEIGSETFINFYAAAWAWEQSTPFQGTKQDASHLGGTRDPLIVSWPARIHDNGGLRTQFEHVTDIAPTIYEAVGVKLPASVDGVAQLPLEGASFIHTFDHPVDASRHHVQYFASEGNRGIYQDGWWAGDLYRNTWESDADIPASAGGNRHPWELYNLTTDYSQAHDLAKENPEKLNEMIALFNREAARNQALPLLQRSIPQPSPASGRKLFVYRSGVDRLIGETTPHLAGTAHTITADVILNSGPRGGVILTQGGKYGGFSLFVKDAHLVYEVNAFGNPGGRVVSRDALGSGPAHIVVSVEPDPGGATTKVRPGKVTLAINDQPEGEARFANLNGTQHGETLDVGKDLGTPVGPEYAVPARFNGAITEIQVQLQ
jgi:arylsulfatase